MSLIHVEDIKKDFVQGEVTVPALRGVSFDIKEGEFTALVGPSGSGKTTLLNMIGALDAPTSGHLMIDGSEYHSMKKNELSDFRLFNIGFVFQAYNLIPVLTAIENVEYVLMLQGIEADERHQRAKTVFEEMEMDDLIDRFPKELSGGQQQRVAVARALVTEPKVVLADEPTANLDSASASKLLDMMSEMQKKKKTTFLFSTHDNRVMERARRIIKMRDGLLQTAS